MINNSTVLLCVLSAISLHAMQSVLDQSAGHPLRNDANIARLYALGLRMSRAIDETFPAQHQVLLGLGQSPAYLLEMMRLQDEQKKRQDRKYIHVAFSGNYFGKLYTEFEDKIDPQKYKTYEFYGPYYRDYLARIGISYRELQRDDTKFIVMDICFMAYGLRSFLSLIPHMQERLGVIAFHMTEEVPPGAASLARWLKPKSDEWFVLFNLGKADEYNDRLVLNFPSHRWISYDPTKFQRSDVAHYLCALLQEFVSNPEKTRNFDMTTWQKIARWLGISRGA